MILGSVREMTRVLEVGSEMLWVWGQIKIAVQSVSWNLKTPIGRPQRVHCNAPLQRSGFWRRPLKTSFRKWKNLWPRPLLPLATHWRRCLYSRRILMPCLHFGVSAERKKRFSDFRRTSFSNGREKNCHHLHFDLTRISIWQGYSKGLLWSGDVCSLSALKSCFSLHYNSHTIEAL